MKVFRPVPPSVSEQHVFADPQSVRHALARSPVLCIGTFDGVHLGQQAILARGVALARETRSPLLALTFHPHPKSVVDPLQAPLLLTEPLEKVALLRSYGAEAVLQLRFDKQLASMSARGFVEEILLRGLDVGSIVIGHDFGFGRGREGTPDFLQDWGQRASRQVTVVQPVTDGILNLRVSSSLIRDSIKDGSFGQAVRLLGHPYPVSGDVVAGAARGRELGYPTWNLRLSECKLPPPVGIYAGWAGRTVPHPAMVYYGSNPTFGGEGLRVEAHLLDVDNPQEAKPELIETIWLDAYVRPEVNFESVDTLRRQLEEDERIVRDILSTQRETNPQP